MLRKHELIACHGMGRRMHLWRYGHFGPPLLVFPSASGMAHEWEAQGMVEALADFIDDGRLKLYCTESNVSEAWTNRERDAAWRLERHQRFESYVVDELCAYIREDCRTPGIPIAVSVPVAGSPGGGGRVTVITTPVAGANLFFTVPRFLAKVFQQLGLTGP